MTISVDYSLRLRMDRRALWQTLAVVAVCAIAFRLTHLQLFAAIIEAVLGLYVIRFCRLAYRDPDETIGAWQSFYSYLRPGSVWSRRFLRGVSVFGLFAGMLLMTSSLVSLLGYSATEHLGFGWLVIGGCAIAALLLLPGGTKL
jgi:hypothetical protein